jgi:hypothetical protein
MDPPDQVVVGGVAVGELDRQLGLADPAQPVHRITNGSDTAQDRSAAAPRSSE